MFRTAFLGFCVFTLAIFAQSAQSVSAATYDFTFDDIDDGVHMAPFVGFGSLRFDGPNPGDGSFAYNSFSNLSLQFQFSAVASRFTEEDAITPLEEVLLVFSDNGQRLQFSNVNPSGSGEFNGAIDFSLTNGMTFGLSTEPPGIGGNLDRYFLGIIPDDMTMPPGDVHFGNYQGQLVPEPEGGVMLFAALAMASLCFRRRRKVVGDLA